MNLMPAGFVNEIMAGKGASKDEVHRFLRLCHKLDGDANGRSYAAIGVIEGGMVWLLSGPDKAELESALRDAKATDAEILELNSLH